MDRFKYEAHLTSGERKIFIFPRTSERKGNAFMPLAAGYEFFENEKSLSALQYLAGGLMISNPLTEQSSGHRSISDSYLLFFGEGNFL